MLKSLSIRDLAILPFAELEFSAGFQAITGETGAGKSILIGALKLILGERAKADLVRQGAEKLRVEATFDIPPSSALKKILAELELDSEDELVLEREVTAAGKSRARVNGTLVALGDLEAVSRHLVDLHGQHEQQGLLDAAAHGEYLDGYAGLSGSASDYDRLYTEARSAAEALQAAEGESARLREQMDFLRFQFQELDKTAPKEGEEESAETELKMLSGLEKVLAGKNGCLDALEGSSGALAAVSRLGRELEGLSKHVGSALSDTGDKVATVRESLTELRDALRRLDIPADADPARIDGLNARLALLQRLRSKYKTDLAGLIALRERRREEIARVENAGMETASLAERRDKALSEARRTATALSGKRKTAARKFDSEVNARLARLGMEGSRFETRISPLVETDGFHGLSSFGSERIEFFLAANPGEPARALRQTASGGEISRVMLAVKGALAKSDPRPTLVFDELDAGIGGNTASRVGEALAELAEHHQLLVITHLHQVASKASHQHRVEKTLEAGRTVTKVVALKEKERAVELARMMGGESSQAALRHAKELLEKRA